MDGESSAAGATRPAAIVPQQLANGVSTGMRAPTSMSLAGSRSRALSTASSMSSGSLLQRNNTAPQMRITSLGSTASTAANSVRHSEVCARWPFACVLMSLQVFLAGKIRGYNRHALEESFPALSDKFVSFAHTRGAQSVEPAGEAEPSGKPSGIEWDDDTF